VRRISGVLADERSPMVLSESLISAQGSPRKTQIRIQKERRATLAIAHLISACLTF
jgi:hypothetical protein